VRNQTTFLHNRIDRLVTYIYLMIYMMQCCSQGQNPKAKDEAKSRTLKAEAKTKTKAWTLQGQGRGRGLDPRDQLRPRPELLSPRPISRPNMIHNLMLIYHTPEPRVRKVHYECEPIYGVWGKAPGGGQGAFAPLKLPRFHKIRGTIFIETCIKFA